MRPPAPNVDLRPDHWAIVCSALRRHVPDREVLAFGSRATWTAKEYSDLDLAVMGEEPLPLNTAAALAEDLCESDLPFKVDIVDWARTDDSFRSIIRRGAVSVQAPTMTPEVAERVRTRSATNVAKGPSGQDAKEDNGGLFSPTFPEHWLPSPLYAMATWVNGLAFRKIQFSETGRPIIKIAELKGGISGQTKFTQQTFDDSVCVRPGDLLFSWSGQPETSIDAFWWRGPEGWLNQHVFRVTPELGLDVTFFYYLLRYLKPNFVGIARNKQTTGLGHVTKRDLKNLRVASPDRSEQRAIAHILGTLDDKIELNRRMNETLEAMARALFKSWFVDFDPVRAKMEGRDTGLPQDITELFPDRLMDSEMGEIPEGWTVFRLDQLADHHTKSTSPARSPRLEYEHFSIPAYDAGQRPVIEPGTGIRSNKTVVLKDAVLLSKLNPRIPRVWVPADSTGRPQICSTEFLVFAPRPPANRSLLFTLFTDQRFRALLESFVTGTSKSHQRVPPKALKAHEVLAGSPRIFAVFGEVIGGMLAPILKNRSEAATLAALRDTLLPKLISGAIRVSDAEKLVGASP